MGSIDRFFATGTALPVMPEVARQLLSTFEDERADLRQIVELAEQDQGLCGRIIRLANSAHYGLGRQVAGLRQAAVVLGLETMRNLMLTSSMVDAFPQPTVLDRLRFWRHSIGTGGYARWIGRSVGFDSDSAYMAGFLLRAGQLLMAMEVPDAIRAIERDCKQPGVRMGLEHQRLGCSHPAVTAELARRWDLPRPLIDAYRHAPEPLAADPFSLLAGVLQLAAIAADAGDLGSEEPGYWCEANPHLLEQLRLDPGWLQANLPSYESVTHSIEALTG